MVSFIITGHGRFASGIVSGIELILGQQKNYKVVDFPSIDTATELTENINAAISYLQPHPIIIFTDLLSGSPFNLSVLASLKQENIYVIYGTNFAMLLEAFLKQETIEDIDLFIRSLIDTGQSQIGVFCDKNDDNVADSEW